MTCIVGLVDKECVIMGGDSAGVSGLDIEIRKDAKVFQVGDFVIGCTSSFRMIQLLRFSFIPPRVNNKDVYEYMCTDFINGVRDCFHEGGYLQRFSEGDEKGGVFLVGYKNRLFRVDLDFQVGENANGVSAIGCGASFALGSLHVTHKANKPPEFKVIKALEAAERFSAGVSRPFILVKT